MLSRREVLVQAAAAAGALCLGASASRAAENEPRFPLIGFTKPFQQLDYEKTADMVATVGWDGIECPVRARGQIEPERSADELPKLVEALRTRQRAIYLVATDITSMKTPHAETVLRTMSKLGIKRLRLGSIQYRRNESPVARLKEIAPGIKDVAEACRELGLQAGIQNHSGAQYVGAPVWDVYSIIESLDPKHMGFCFDIGHATVEGGLSWPVEARLAEPFYTAIIVKDFVWKKTPEGWKDGWCPLGEGMVNRVFFNRLKQSAYSGPICQHHEYELGNATEMTDYMKHDLKVLREWLS